MKRREFITGLMALSTIFPFRGTASTLFSSKRKDFSFLLLGDLHFDKLAHHDMSYVKKNFPNDVHQIINYSRITSDNIPVLMQVVKKQVKEYNAKFILQLGDFLEGICGSYELAETQATDFIRYIDNQKFKRPFITVKGNHDITGEGAKEVYVDTILPWQSDETGKNVTSANITFVHNNMRFVIFDGYAKDSLDWVNNVLKNHKENLLFFCTHVPIVPYDSRSNWYQYYGNDVKREELLNLLGKHHAIVLSGHLHKTSVVVRNTGQGTFIQLALFSCISELGATLNDQIKGVEYYNGDLVDLEPDFSPSSAALRRQILEKEAPFIRYFEYANTAGYGIINVTENYQVNVSFFANDSLEPWTTVNLSNLLQI